MTHKKEEETELKFDGYRLSTANNHKGEEYIMINFPSDEGFGISKEKLIEFLDKLYDEEF